MIELTLLQPISDGRGLTTEKCRYAKASDLNPEGDEAENYVINP